MSAREGGRVPVRQTHSCGGRLIGLNSQYEQYYKSRPRRVHTRDKREIVWGSSVLPGEQRWLYRRDGYEGGENEPRKKYLPHWTTSMLR
jgi:hypothetical protein